MSDFSIKIHGLTETERAFRQAGEHIPPEFRDELQAIGERLAEGARGEAMMKGDFYRGRGDHGDPSRRPGDLIHKITSRKGKGFSAVVTEKSRTHTKRYPGGYPYPSRLEYEAGGRRAFMRPAVEAMEPRAVEMVDELVDRIFGREGF